MTKSNHNFRLQHANRIVNLFPGDSFVAVPKFLYDDLAAGKLSLGMANVFLILLEQCDYQTGMWKGSAPKVQCGIAEAIPRRTIQSHLETLAEAGYIKSFHQQGKRGNYFVAICDYRVRIGQHAGMLLEANATTDPSHPVYKEYASPESDTWSSSVENGGTTANPSPPHQRSHEETPETSTNHFNGLEESRQRKVGIGQLLFTALILR